MHERGVSARADKNVRLSMNFQKPSSKNYLVRSTALTATTKSSHFTSNLLLQSFCLVQLFKTRHYNNHLTSLTWKSEKHGNERAQNTKRIQSLLDSIARARTEARPFGGRPIPDFFTSIRYLPIPIQYQYYDVIVQDLKWSHSKKVKTR